MIQVKLSVIVLTYNHREFIREAMDSIRAQEVDFDFEVIFADDASLDGTPEIVKLHLANWDGFRGKPICLFRHRNLGMQRNAIDAIAHARGKYIAFLEGDDYWIDPQKLRLQVMFLEANPDHFLCAHKTMIRVADKTYKYEWRLNKFRETYSVQDYVGRLFFHTSSIVLRARREFPSWLESIKQFDQAFVMLSSTSESHKIKVLPRNMSVYRLHAGGITQTAAHLNKQITHWSYVRLLCGVRRECPWIGRRCLHQKMRETLTQARLRSARSFLSKLSIILRNVPIFLRLVLYKYASARMPRFAVTKEV